MSIGLYLLRDWSAGTTPGPRAQTGSDLLRLALAHHCATDLVDWQLGRADSGARIVIDGPLPTPALSLAHTGDLLVAAVTDVGSIGVDIERPRERRYSAIARFLGWPSSLWAQADAPTADEFLHLWTLWEALIKAMPNAALADVRRMFTHHIGQSRAGFAGAVVTEKWSGRSWHCPGYCWLSVVTWSSLMPEIPLFQVDRLAGDVESARIKKIPAPEGKFHF